MWHIVCTQVYKPASIQVCKFVNLQIYNYVSKDTSMQSLQYVSMQGCHHKRRYRKNCVFWYPSCLEKVWVDFLTFLSYNSGF